MSALPGSTIDIKSNFFVVTLVRICRQLTGRHLPPVIIKFMHRRAHLPAKLKSFFGCKVEFGSDLDEVAYRQPFKDTPIVDADPYLNSLLVKYSEEASPRAMSGRALGD